ncbi:MAG: hypothetical protein E6767_06325 [Dysgonomonas sp.]|nr:hypothetical protein [Dysgonomonas sp.]
MNIPLNILKIEKSLKITTGDIIRCESFTYGIFYPKAQKEIFVGWAKREYEAHLRQAIKQGNGIDSYDQSRGNASFLVLSMELVETQLPEDVEEDTRYIGLNVKCIRLTSNNELSRESERIFFTLHHPMSCLDPGEGNIEVIGHLKLPIYWNEKSDSENATEKAF